MNLQDQLEEAEKTLREVKTIEGLIRSQAQSGGHDPLAMRTMDGDFMMLPILAAKAQLLPLINTLESQISVEETGEKVKGWFEGLTKKPPEESQ